MKQPEDPDALAENECEKRISDEGGDVQQELSLINYEENENLIDDKDKNNDRVETNLSKRSKEDTEMPLSHTPKTTKTMNKQNSSKRKIGYISKLSK